MLLSALLLTPLTADAGPPAQAGPAGGGRLVLALKNASATQSYQAVGMLLSRSCPSGRCGMFATCSLVLVAPDVAVTAAHCVENPDKAYRVFFPGARLVPVRPDGVTRFCDGQPDCDPVSGDLAVLRLSRPVTGIAPVARSPTLPSAGIIAGYGDSGPLRADNGILRQATVPIERCGPRTLCYRFDQASPAACNHDSGGPMFAADGLLLGLASQTGGGCVAGQGTYIRVTGSWVESWWQAHAGPGDNAAVAGMPEHSVLGIDCSREACWRRVDADGLRIPFHVGEDSDSLAVSINYALRSDCDAPGRDRCIADYDLGLRAPGTGEHSCRCENGLHQVSVCSCDAPAAGEWTAVVSSVANKGPFQLTGRATMRDRSAAE